jgi:hypothetical protein
MRALNLVNSLGSTFPAPFLIVRQNGTTGQMVLAQADTIAHATGIAGVCVTAPLNGAPGLVVNTGVEWVQCDGAITPGTIVYLSEVNAGQGKGTAPFIPIPIGTCVATNGTLAKVNLGIFTSTLPNGILYSVGSDIDCFAAAGNLSAVVPLITGKNFVGLLAMNYVIIARTGVLTGTPAFKAGTNGAHDNYSNPLTVTTLANLNTVTPGLRAAFGVTLTSGVFQQAPDMTLGALTIETTTAATGVGATLVIRPIAIFAPIFTV